jgi:hypothetical protein
MIMLDLQKAFDTVNHYILCSKLQTMAVKSTKWFESYLTDRKQKDFHVMWDNTTGDR